FPLERVFNPAVPIFIEKKADFSELTPCGAIAQRRCRWLCRTGAGARKLVPVPSKNKAANRLFASRMAARFPFSGIVG
ncbi:MAG TPA: hypothetical protein VKH62_14720, partial [Candidatus Binatia bacterium]|nr:hypothetical protein [Candidatus Binatia bacterium]